MSDTFESSLEYAGFSAVAGVAVGFVIKLFMWGLRKAWSLLSDVSSV